jgi:hypothetical protein
MHESDREDTETVDPQEMLMRAVPALRDLPAGIQVCVIQEGERLLLYNVNRAHELTRGRSPTAVVDVAERARLLHPRGAELPPEDRAQINPEHAMTVDLTYPVLLLESMDELDGSPGGRLIDGWHRVYKAAQLGIAELPAIVITTEEEALIRIMPGDQAP